MADEVVIRANENGPYVVKGDAVVLDADGRAYDTRDKATFALCRCGASENKPFCDGTHSRIGFDAPERAVTGAEGEG